MKLIDFYKNLNKHHFFVNLFSKEDMLGKINSYFSKKQTSSMICFYLNSGSLYYCYSSKEFYQAFKSANVYHSNSFLLTNLLKYLKGQNFQKLNAEDFVYDLLKKCEIYQKKVFLLGSKDNQHGIRGAVQHIQALYPKLKVNGYHGYFKSSKKTLDSINKFKSDILLVGLGAGKQEIWISQNKKQLKSVKIIIAIGNFIGVMGGERRAVPILLKKLNLEWLYRLASEPGRVWKRYIFGGPLLITALLYGKLVSPIKTLGWTKNRISF